MLYFIIPLNNELQNVIAEEYLSPRKKKNTSTDQYIQRNIILFSFEHQEFRHGWFSEVCLRGTGR